LMPGQYSRTVEGRPAGVEIAFLTDNVPAAFAKAIAEGAVAIANPLSAEHGFLRRRLLPGLIREVERNWNAHSRDVRLFEIGTVFTPAGPGERPIEKQHVAVVLTGARAPEHWTAPGGAGDLDRWDLQGILDATIQLANAGATVQVESGGWSVSRSVGQSVGWAGMLKADSPRWAAPLFGFELEIEPGAASPIRYRSIPTTPAAERDLALLVPDTVSAGQVLAEAKKAGGQLLEQVRVVDEYRGKGLPAGTRSVAFRFTWRSAERTLRDEEIEAGLLKVRKALEQSLGATLRTA